MTDDETYDPDLSHGWWCDCPECEAQRLRVICDG